jgi:hypothetical protein
MPEDNLSSLLFIIQSVISYCTRRHSGGSRNPAPPLAAETVSLNEKLAFLS